MRLVVASANADKVAEMAAILEPAGVELVARPDDLGEVVEDAETLEGNARLKASAVCEATSSAAVADDTGLEVDALGRAPGVRSARYAGEDATYEENVEHLLDELARVGAFDASQRRARFRTLVLVRFPDGSELVAEGAVSGTIAEEAIGANGFGYDSVFVPDGADGRTFAQMTAAEKHSLSHRGKALRALAEELEALGS